MATVPIGNVLLPVGTRTFGPVTVADSDSNLRVELDRTLNNGLNARPVTSTLNARFELSTDGGASWALAGETTFEGGVRSDPETGQLNLDYLECSLPPGTGRIGRVVVTVAGGSSIRVSGALITT